MLDLLQTEDGERIIAQIASVAARAATEQAHESWNVDLGYIKRDLAEIKERLDKRFVSIEAFEPIRKLVHGQVAVILIAFLGAVVALVLKK